MMRFFLVTIVYFVLCSTDDRISAIWARGPSIETLEPPIGTRAQAFQVTVRGSQLDRVREVVFYRPGLKCESIAAHSPEEIMLSIAADRNCTLEAIPFRLRSDSGLSELKTITVSPFSLVKEHEEVGPQQVACNTTVVGTLERDDVDVYLVSVQRGDRFSGEVHGVRLGMGLLDTKLLVKSPSGSRVFVADDSPMLNQDPCFSIHAEESGLYRVEITAVGANADADSYYALHLGDFPRPQGVYPLGSQSGEPVEILLFQKEKEEPNVSSIRIDSTTHSLDSLGTQYLEIAEHGIACPSRIPWRISNFSNHPDGSVAAEAPVAFHGEIKGSALSARHVFRVAESGRYSVEVFASRMGSLLDSLIEIKDTSGRTLARCDDLETHDSKVELHAESGMDYAIEIRDKRAKSGDLFHYRIEVTPTSPSAIVFLPRRDKLSQYRHAIEVPAGNRVLGLLGLRTDLLSDSLDLRIKLDSSLSCVSYAESMNDCEGFLRPVVFQASADCQPGVSLADVTLHRKGAADEGKLGSFRQVVDLVAGPADSLFQQATVDRLAIAVIKECPFQVELQEPTVAIPTDGVLGIRVQVDRETGFRSPLEITLSPLPEWMDAPTSTTIGPDDSHAMIRLRALPGVSEMVWPIAVEAKVIIQRDKTSPSNRRIGESQPDASPLDYPVVCSSLRQLTIAKSPCSAKPLDLVVEQGADRGATVGLTFHTEVPLPLTATLEGLPNRVKAEPVLLQSASQEIGFKLQIAPDAPIGEFTDLVCKLSCERDGQPVDYFVARGSKLTITAKGGANVDSSGRRLSPLEVLRKRSAKEEKKL